MLRELSRLISVFAGEDPPLDSVCITHWSLRDPLTESQVLPVLRALGGSGYRFALLTYEQPIFAVPEAEKAQTIALLQTQGIEWYPIEYHNRPAIFSTLWDCIFGFAQALQLGCFRRARLLHSRGTVAALPAALAVFFLRVPFFYDADGPLSEERVDAGAWSAGSLRYWITHSCESFFARSADAVAVLTRARKTALGQLARTKIDVIPCAVDIKHFVFDPRRRRATRESLGLNGVVFLYAGKTGGCYAVAQMMDFVAVARSRLGDVRLLIVSTQPCEQFLELAGPRRLLDILVFRRGARETMPDYLCAADVGLSFVVPGLSKSARSPIKNGEYLACGLPILSPRGVGDYSDLIEQKGVGFVLDTLSLDEYERVARRLAALLADPDLPDRCRRAASTEVGLDEVVMPRYLSIYERLVGSRKYVS